MFFGNIVSCQKQNKKKSKSKTITKTERSDFGQREKC
jgi:hypothetical protein